MLEAAGCNDPDRVLNAFARILAQGQLALVCDPVHSSITVAVLAVLLCPCGRKHWVMPVTGSVCWAGSRKQGRVDPQDVAVVRECGEKAIETYREKAVKARRRRQISHRRLVPVVARFDVWPAASPAGQESTASGSPDADMVSHLQEDDSMLDAMEVEALKEVGTSTGLTGFGAAITLVRFLCCPCHLLAVPAAAVHPPPHRKPARLLCPAFPDSCVCARTVGNIPSDAGTGSATRAGPHSGAPSVGGGRKGCWP